MSSIANNKMVSDVLMNQMPQVPVSVQPERSGRVQGARVPRLTPPTTSHSFTGRLTAAPRELLRSVKAGLGGFLGWCELHVRSHKSEMESSYAIKVTVKGEEKTVRFSGRALAAMIGKAGVVVESARTAHLELLQKRAENGRQLVKEILADGPMPLATPEAVADLTLYLRCAAAANGDDFERGAFSVEDPKGRLYGFLDGCKEAYVRSSTHLGSLQNVRIDGHTNTQRGIDLPVGANGMPARIRTVLYGGIPEYNGQSRRIYIKPETHGCYLNKPGDILPWDIGRSDRFHGNRGYRFGDLKESVCHCASLVKVKSAGVVNKIKSLLPGKGGQGVDPLALQARREKLPEGVAVCFKGLTDAVAAKGAEVRTKDEAEAAAALLKILQKDDPLGAHAGIRAMVRNLDEARAKCPEVLGYFQPLVDSLMRQCEAVDPQHSLHARIGNEVMLNLDEIV